MGLRVGDGGGSEGLPVMGRIGVELAGCDRERRTRATSPHAKAGRLPPGRSSRESLANHSQEGKQMTAGLVLAGAPSSGAIHAVAPSVYREVVTGG
jgi:hypothetical protein